MRVVPLATIAVALLAGCSDTVEPTPPVLPGSVPPPCELTRSTYIVDSITAPENPSEGLEFAFDLDGDQFRRPDNHLANVRLLPREANEQMDQSLQASLDAGQILWIFVMEACTERSENYVRISTAVARDLNDDPSDNFSGVEEMEIILEGDLPSVGARDVAGVATTNQGVGIVPLAPLFDVETQTAEVSWQTGVGMTTELTEVSDGVSIRIGMGVDHESAFAAVLEPMRRSMMWIVARDAGCPTQCEDSSAAQFLLNFYDDDDDGIISIDDLKARGGWFRSLMGADVDLRALYEDELVYWPRTDGVMDSSSIGLALHAVPVQLTE